MLGSLLNYFASPSALRDAGVLGMNRRNHDYIAAYNKRKYYPMVDDKLITKELALKVGVPTAGLIGTIRYQYEAKNFMRMTEYYPSFVIKPGHGSGGRGILVIKSHDGENFRKADGSVIGYQQVYSHITNILSGLYSLGGQIDYALFEECISFSEIFSDFSYQGVPDIRIIVFQGYPVMAMMRLATKRSDGRA
ncbi:MAG: sugar-transfer associated ATP-grasp domain-containing protein, partial [Victivallales bacterium]